MPRRHVFSVALPGLFVLILLLAACGGGEDALPEGTAAQVGDAKISYAELDRSVAQRKAQAEQAGQTFPEEGTDGFNDVRREALDALVQQKVVDFEATKCDKACAVTDKEIDEELGRIRKENFNDSQEELDTFLEESQITDADARSILKFQLQQPKLFDETTRGVRFTDKQAKEYYDSNKAEFVTEPGRTAAHILVETEKEAKEIAGQVNLENFSELASERSQDPGSKDQGGALQAEGDRVQRGSFVEPFEKVVFELKNGEISDPVKTQFGWHIITVETFPETTTTFAEAKGDIKASQLDLARQTEWNDWREGIVEEWREKTRYAEDGLKPPDPDAEPEVEIDGQPVNPDDIPVEDIEGAGPDAVPAEGGDAPDAAPAEGDDAAPDASPAEGE